MNFKFRCNDMEVRSCNKHLLSDGEHTTAEIIYWLDRSDNLSCYTIAYWVLDREGYYLKFVGQRPLYHYECWSDFGDLVKCGQWELDKYFNTIEFENGSSITSIPASENIINSRGKTQLDNLIGKIDYIKTNAIGCDINEDNRFRGVR